MTTLVVFLLFRSSVCADVRLLESRLLSNYSSIIKPRRDQTQSVLVNITFTMNSLRTVEERFQYITFMGWFIVTWYDEFLSWDEREFSGLKTVNIPYTKVWVPDISLYFSETNTHDLGVNPFVSVYSSGLVTWYPGDYYTMECLLNIQKFPFDTQSCELRIAAWQTTDWMQKLVPKRRKNEISQMSENGEWEFIDIDLRSVFMKEFNMTEVRYTLFLRRRPLYALISTVFPVVLLAVLNSLAYSLPVTSGERMTYCLTVLLAFTVFLTLFEENMPRKSTNIPFLSLYLGIHIMFSVISILVSIIVIRDRHFIVKADDMFSVQNEVEHFHAYENKTFRQFSSEKSQSSEENSCLDKNFNKERNDVEGIENSYESKIEANLEKESEVNNKADNGSEVCACCSRMLKRDVTCSKMDTVMLKVSVTFTVLSTVALGLLFYL